MTTTKPPVPADRLHECTACGAPFITVGDFQRNLWALPEGTRRGVKGTMLCSRDHWRVKRHGSPVRARQRAADVADEVRDRIGQGYSWDRSVDQVAQQLGVQRDSVMTALRRARRRGHDVPQAVAA